MSEKQNIFETLSKVDVSGHVETIRMKRGPALKYVSWAWAWSMVKSIYPDTTREIATYPEFAYNEKTGEWYATGQQLDYRITPAGCEVKVTVKIQGESYSERLYVMDMRNQPVMKPNIAQINKTQQRCLVKALAMAGLGLNLYAGEDLPMGDINESDQKQAAEQKVKKQEQANFQKAKKKYVDYMEQLQEITKQSADVINDQAKQRVLKADSDYNKRTPLEKMLIINTFLEKMLSENKATKQETLEEVDA